jgi:class 3 adenylate cyclase
MFFRKRREERERILAARMLEWVGRDGLVATLKARGALPAARQKLVEVEVICAVAHLQNFEWIAAQLSLRDLADQMNKFYAAIADAILPSDGDVSRYCGGTVVAHFNVLHKVEEARIIEGAMNVFRGACAAFDAKHEVKIGVGICRGVAISGDFGSMHRNNYSAFGPCVICAHHLAQESAALNICDEFASHFSRPRIPAESWISVRPHWRIEA